MSVDELNEMVDGDQYGDQYGTEPRADEPADVAFEQSVPDELTFDEPTANGPADDERTLEQPNFEGSRAERLPHDETTLDDEFTPVEPVLETAPTADSPDGADGAESPESVDGAEEVVAMGHPVVDAVVQRLNALDELPVDEHIDVYEDAHRRLHETLLAAGEDSDSA